MNRLVDSFGRQMGDLRISITDRCNFRCRYCMPEEGLPWMSKEKILTFPEMTRLASICVRMGVREVRLTGGEPLLRLGISDLVRMLIALKSQGLESLSLTTNGFLLTRLARELAEAGLTRINVSLDSLVRGKFHHITRRDALAQVLAGLEELERHPGIWPIKIYAVAMRDFSEEEVLAFAELARRKPYIVRFIEYMPLDADGRWRRELVLTGKEIFDVVNAWHRLVPVPETDVASTAKRFRFADGIGEIGLIDPVSEPFCEHCNRIRLTADGQIRTCLFSIDEVDLRTPMRGGAGDEELAAIIVAAVKQKELKHKINEGTAFQRASRSMSQIGG